MALETFLECRSLYIKNHIEESKTNEIDLSRG